ncbi:putative toxin-antitoxin system toxin component, PIN family [Chromatocurvus halotolerans]|uniref:Putative PIN family toxin of toxin-antitoxin system n=1 Tax=Chromatocurvus halotolerans TaxID=1132028 RepID=A0A4R2KRW5_9GAMM|nr:putative toxin-antitoxin system toxin component, PIN family [Chromatocurvus halotolerans]TCO73736.1 putative PIN family toxin of toxin-antitoxin system [Chromatocurvus halotolerans]
MRPPVVVDTNVVVAGLITGAKESPVVVILDAMLSGQLLYLLSPALLAEYRAVLLRPKLTALHGLVVADVDQLLVELTANGIWREPAAAPHAPDRNDDHLWELLHDFPGSALITGDRLLQEKPPAGISVISPSAWIHGIASSLQ